MKSSNREAVAFLTPMRVKAPDISEGFKKKFSTYLASANTEIATMQNMKMAALFFFAVRLAFIWTLYLFLQSELSISFISNSLIPRDVCYLYKRHPCSDY